MGLEFTKKKGAPVKKPPTAMEVKTFIMVAQNKLTLYRNKKVQLIKQKRKEVIASLKENNLDVAKAKMDSIIREEDLITAYDILGPLCEILKEKVTYIMSSDKCPPDIRAPLDTLIYSSSRLEVEELHKLNELIGMKYGLLYITQGSNNVDGLVNVNIVEKLRVKPASDAFITIRLKQLCKEENLVFDFPCEVIGGNEAFQSGGEMFNQPGMDMNNPYNPQGGNPYGSQFDVSTCQAGNWNQNQGQMSQFNNQQQPPQFNLNQNPYGGGGFDNYNKQINNEKPNFNQNFGQNPYENVKMSQQGNPYENVKMSQQGNPYENVKMSQQSQKPFGMQQSQQHQQPPVNYNNQSNINSYSQVQNNNQQKQSSIPQNSQFNPNDFSRSNIQNNKLNMPEQKPQFDPNIFPNTNSQMDFPKNPSQFNPNDFNNKSNIPDPLNFSKNLSQVNPNDFPKPSTNSSQMNNDFPKNPSQFNPNDFSKSNNQEFDFPKNPSQFNPNDFPKPNTNPSEMKNDFPKNPSQFNPNIFPSPNTNSSQMNNDFPKNPSQFGKPGDYQNNSQMKQTPSSNPYVPTSNPNPSINLPSQSQFKDNKDIDDSFNPYSINDEANQCENKSSVSTKLYKNNPMKGFDVEDDEDQKKPDNLDFP